MPVLPKKSRALAAGLSSEITESTYGAIRRRIGPRCSQRRPRGFRRAGAANVPAPVRTPLSRDRRSLPGGRLDAGDTASCIPLDSEPAEYERLSALALEDCSERRDRRRP